MMKTLALFLASVVICGCSQKPEEKSMSEDKEKNSVVVESLNIDNYFVKGKNLQSFATAPKRVFVVGENETETLLELGAENSIFIAAAQNRRKYAMRPENAAKLKKLKTCDSSYLNMEYLTMLNPDLIVAQQCIFIKNRLKDTDYWNTRGIRTMVPLNSNTPSKHIHPETIETEMQFIEDLGKAFRLEGNAKRIIDNTYSTIEEVKEKSKAEKKPKVMIVEFLRSFICYDKTKIIGNMAERIGAVINENPPVIGYENIVKEDPDILFLVCSHVDYGVCAKNLWDNKALKNLKCIKNKQVYTVPLRFTYAPQCRTEDGIKYLAERMYPNIKFSWQ